VHASTFTGFVFPVRFIRLAMSMSMSMPLLLHCAGFVLVDISILVRVHPVEHYVGMARMLFLADPTVIVCIGHRHPAPAFAIFLVTVRTLVVVMRHCNLVALVEGLRGEWVIAGGSDGCGAKRSNKRRSNCEGDD